MYKKKGRFKKPFKTAKSKRAIISWAFFDWANSSFPVIITTFIFATYFTEKIAANKITGTSDWGDTIAISGIIIAILSPILGAIADTDGRRKPWIAFFSLICIVSTSLLWFSKPSPEYITWTLVCVAFGTIGLEVGAVFYNAMLKDLVIPKYTGRVSGWAWGLGYFGGLTSLTLALFIFVRGNYSWLPLDKTVAEHIRINGPFVAIWFLLFSWPLFVFTPDRPSSRLGARQTVKKAFKTLHHTFKELNKFREIVKFLIARILYIDGLNTIFAFGGIYAAGTFNMGIDEVILFGITLNVGAGIGAAIFAWVDDYIGSKPTILITLVIMIISGTAMLIIKSKVLFWILGTILSLGVGPVQAASRSLMIRISPEDLITEMFGLYALSGKATSFLGPAILASLTELTKSQRFGMSTVIYFLLFGGAILLTVKVKRPNNPS